jgi:hypothetical protein
MDLQKTIERLKKSNSRLIHMQKSLQKKEKECPLHSGIIPVKMPAIFVNDPAGMAQPVAMG